MELSETQLDTIRECAYDPDDCARWLRDIPEATFDTLLRAWSKNGDTDAGMTHLCQQGWVESTLKGRAWAAFAAALDALNASTEETYLACAKAVRVADARLSAFDDVRFRQSPHLADGFDIYVGENNCGLLSRNPRTGLWQVTCGMGPPWSNMVGNHMFSWSTATSAKMHLEDAWSQEVSA